MATLKETRSWESQGLGMTRGQGAAGPLEGLAEDKTHPQTRKGRCGRGSGRPSHLGCRGSCGCKGGCSLRIRRGQEREGRWSAQDTQPLLGGPCADPASRYLLSVCLLALASAACLSQVPAPAEKLAVPSVSHQPPGPSASWAKGRFRRYP